MKCYYHNERDAVATCKKCNKHLCRECYDRGQNGTCSGCLNLSYTRTKLEEIDKRRVYIRSSLLALLIGAVIGVFLANKLINYETSKNIVMEFKYGYYPVLALITGYGLFSLYWGKVIMSNIFDRLLDGGWILIFTWPILVVLLAMAIFIGVYASLPMMIYNIVAYQRLKRKQVISS